MSEISTTIQKILVLTSSSTGNNVFCTPAIRFLHKHLPHAQIDVVALNKLSAQVFENSPDINNLYVFDSVRKFDKLAKNYEKVICLNTNALRRMKGIRTLLAIIPNYVGGIARSEQQLTFVSGLIGKDVEDVDRRYVIGDGIPVHFSELDKYNIQPTDILISIHLGCGTTLLHGWKFFYSKRADDKRLWSIDRYIELGNALVEANPNIRIIITGTRNESFLAKKFQKNVARTINLVNKTSAKDIFDLMHDVDLFIAHDCGVFHLAAATEVPIVGLYGVTDPVLAGPFPVRPQHKIIEAGAMAEISVPEVLAASVILLEKFSKRG